MEKLSENITVILGASALLLLITLFIVLILMAYQKKDNKYFIEKKNMQQEFNKQLLQSQIEMQEATLFALGKDLHDNIGQLLNSSKMLLVTARRTISEAPEILSMAEETLIKAISELRSLSKSLDKEWLQQFNFIENLSTEVRRINTAKILQINFCHPDKISLQPDAQIILFRIVQEAIQNAVKHSGAENIEIIISEPASLLVKIIDNGKGFDKESISNGLGIKNMRHRTELLGGTIEWNSSTSGSSVSIELPLKNKE